MFVITGRLRSTVLYGTLALIVCAFLPNIDLSSLSSAKHNTTGLLSMFVTFMFISPVAYLVLMAIHVVMCKIDDRIRGTSGKWTHDVLGALIEDIGNPLRDLFVPFFVPNDSRGVRLITQWIVAGLCLIWAVALIAFLIYGFVATM